MHLHSRKMIAPILVTVVMSVYYLVYFGFLMWLLDGVWRILLGIMPLAFLAVMIWVCIQRIREIKEGEEDDLSQY